MPTPLEIINSQRPGRQVVVYSPGRPAPGRQPLPARRAVPQPRNRAEARAMGRQGPGVDWSGLAERVTNTPEAQRKRQEEAQKQAEDEAYDTLPWYKKGLGMVIGNPVSKAILTPLDAVFGTIGRTSVLGTEEAAEAYQEHVPDWLQNVLSVATPATNILRFVDTERTDADKRSNWEKIQPGSSYGYGELLDPDNPEWVNRVGGLAGDIILDPTTYVSGGATKVPGALKKGALLAEAATATEEAARLAKFAPAGKELEALAARGGKLSPTLQQGLEYSLKAAEQESLAKRLTAEAAAIPDFPVRMAQGRKAREGFLGEIAETRPQLLEEFGPELKRGAERGFNTVRDPALREALGLQRPVMKWAGIPIPRSSRAVEEFSRLSGAARAGLNRTPLVGKAMGVTSSKGLEEASRVLSRGKSGDVLRAATTVRIQNLLRRGAGGFEGRANRALTLLAREFKGESNESIRALFHAAEAEAKPNRFNQFFGHDLPKLYERVAGRPMGVSANPDTYVPHMMTPEFKRFLAAHRGDMTVEQYMKKAGFVGDDLLEGSHYLEKARQLKPKEIGKDTTFKLGDREITLNDGTLRELNEQLDHAFPEFKGRAYMDDPIQIGEAYISSVARQAGRDLALDRMAQSPNKLVQEISGPILEAIEARNAWARKNPVTETIRKGYTKGQRLGAIPVKGEAPTSEFDDVFAWTKHIDETQQQRNYLMREGKQFVEDVGADVSATRSTLADNLKALRSKLMAGLKRKTTEAETEIKRMNLILDKVDAEIRKVGSLTTENVDDLVGMSHTVSATISDTKAEIKKIRDRYGKKIPREQKRIESELQKTLRRLEDQERAIEAQYAKGTDAMRKEAAARRKVLQEPIDQAAKAVEAAEAAHPRIMSKERVQAADVYKRTDFETEDAYEAERQLFADALKAMRDNNIPIYRTVEGKLTPETTETVKEIVAEIRETKPPVPDIPTPPPAATVEATAETLTPEQQLRQAMTRQAEPKGAPPVPDLQARVQDLRNRFRDAVEANDDDLADQIEAELEQAEAQLRAAGTEAPPVTPEAPAAPPAPPPAPDTKLTRQPDGNYASEDGFEVIREGKQWRVRYFEDDFGAYPTIKDAREEVKHQQEMLEIPVGEEITPSPVPEPAAAAPGVETTPPPTTKRITRKWATKDVPGVGDETRQVAALTGPDEGWTVEPFMEAPPMRMSDRSAYMPAELEGPRLPIRDVGQPQGPGRTRYAAFHPSDDRLRGRTFASEREAKIAVEDMLRRDKHKITAAEYAARGEMQRAPVFTTYENLSGARQFPPSSLTPEEAAANRARAQATPNLQRPTPATDMGPNELALTEEGAALLAQRPPPSRNFDNYNKAYAEWREAQARSIDPNLTAAERSKAKREAKTLGGQFTQTSGKYYQRHAAETVIANDVAWRTAMDEDPAVIAARAAHEKAVAAADQQVESMVYLKHHNPVSGDDEYARLPAGSLMGFEGGGERVPVPIEPPTQGYTPGNIRAEDVAARGSNYSPGQRAADRNMIDSAISSIMPTEIRGQYDELAARAASIEERVTQSMANRDELQRLDEAVKAAYTDQVQQADAAVKQAKQLEERARLTLEGEYAPGARRVPEAEARTAYADAQRVTRRAEMDRNQVNQAWMNADRELKAKLAERDEYLRSAAEVTRAEQAIHAAYRKGDEFIADVRAGTLPKDLTVGGQQASEEMKKLARNLRQADQKLDAAEAAGAIYLTDAEHRRLQGVRNDIDLEQRELVNQLMQSRAVTPGRNVLPRVEHDEEIFMRPDLYTERFGAETQGTNIPPTMGTGDELKARAFAESLEPTQPGQRVVTSLTEEGAPVSTTRLGGREIYEPRTEREAITALEREARDIESGPVGEELGRQRENIASERTVATDAAAIATEETERMLRAERDEALLPLRDRVQTYQTVQDALDNKAKLIPQRDAAAAQRKTIVDAKATKKADLVQVANDIEAVAKQNPDMLDDDLAVVEALLQDTRKEAERVTENDLTRKQVQDQIDKVGRKDDKSLDIMLTTVGKNWKMLYEATGKKKAVLQAGDTILDAELHRMFTNLYEMKTDKVLFGRTFNAFTNLFKTYATLTPGFHVRNALSAIFMNATDGVGLATQLSGAQLWKQYMKGGEEWLANPGHFKGFTPQQIQDAFDVAFGSGAGGRFTEAGFAEVAGEGGIAERFTKGLQRNKFTRLSQRTGERVEGSVRLAMGLDSMRIGHDVETAIKRVNRIHFDYGDISKFDEQAKRVVPFWTFMSRNMPMQVSQMWTHPRVYTQYEHFVDNMSSVDEEFTPEYWKKAGIWNTGLRVPDNSLPIVGAASGLPIYAAPDLGYTRLQSDLKDYEEFLSGRRPGAVLGQANPLLSAPAEYFTRQDIFTGQRFEKGETVPAEGIANLPIQVLARILGQSEGGEVDAAFANSVRALNPLQDRTLRLLPQAGGSDPEGMQRQLESLLRVGVGAPVRTLTPKQQQNEYMRRYYDVLNATKRSNERAQRRAAG